MAHKQYKSRLRFGPAANNLLVQAIEITEEYAADGYEMTLRQLYYQLVSRDMLPNNQNEYDRLGDIIARGRLAGFVDWDFIVDRTRNLEEVSTWNAPTDIIRAAASSFKIDLWKDQKMRPEVWIEKDALLGVIEPICKRLRLPYFSCRGYSSLSEMHSAGMRFSQYIADHKQCPIIFHMGDHDPSGLDMTRDIRDRLSMFINGNLNFGIEGGFIMPVQRLALNMEQIEEHDPPPNPTKFSDSRSSSYVEEYGNSSWELDALDPPTMEGLIQAAFDQHVNRKAWSASATREAKLREPITLASQNWDAVAAHATKLGPPKRRPAKKKKKKGKKKK